MSLQPYRDEELNYFKFSSIVLNEFPKALRQSFRTMWDNIIGGRPGFQQWDDSAAVRNMLLSLEGGKTKIPTHKSFMEWDCTALFQATIYAKTFSSSRPHTHSTLSDLYVKPRGVLHGSFHSSVVSPGGNNAETVALAIDQLRLLRNSICHSSSSELEKKTFDQYIQYAKDAFKALGLKTDVTDAVGSLTESDVPTSKVRELEQGLREETRRYIEFLEDISEFKSVLAVLKKDTANKDNIAILEKKIKEAQEIHANDLKSDFGELKRKLEDVRLDVHELNRNVVVLQQKGNNTKTQNRDNTEPIISGIRGLPPMVPNFTGRQSERQELVGHVNSSSTRMLSICGSPGFGKTSVAIAVGYDLQSNGVPVCWLTLRGLKSKADLTSELLQSIANRQPSSEGMSLENELCQVFSEISKQCVFILDNADDLLESGEPGIKDGVMELLQNLLVVNEKVKFILTTRESLKVMKLNFQGHHEMRIEPLDEASSQCLVDDLLPNASVLDVHRITKLSGNVPLAIKLICSSISEDDDAQPSQFLEALDDSSIVKMLDETDYPDNLRLSFLFDSSFQRLSSSDKEALVSVSIFPENFDIEVCAFVLEKTDFDTRKVLQRLRRKSLLGPTSKPGTFTMHKLIQSFAREKGNQDILKELVLRSTARFHEFYVSHFEKLNEEFLTGNSMSAFVTFNENKMNFIQSLIASCSHCTRADRVFDVLVKAELFLDSLFWCDGHWFFLMYDSVLKAARVHGKDEHYRRLVLSKAFSELTWGGKGISLLLLTLVKKLHKASSTVPSYEKAKYLCYLGIYQLVDGETETGLQHLREAISLMKNSPEETLLKIIAFQILAVNFKFRNDASMAPAQFYNNALQASNKVGDTQLIVIPPNNKNKMQIDAKTTLPNQPAILQVIYHVQKATKHSSNLETTTFQRNILLKMLNNVQASLQESGPGLFSFYQVVVAMLHHFEKGCDESTVRKEEVKNYQVALEHSKNRFKEEHSCTADSYHALGGAQYRIGDFTSALQSKERALEIRRTLFGDKHPATATSYNSLGIVQHKMGDLARVLQLKQRALEIRRTLFGEEHSDTAMSYDSVGVTQHEMGDLTAALQSKKHASEIWIKLFGEEHSDTAMSYDSVGVTQHLMGDLTAALQSKKCASEIRLKLFGEEHSETAMSYDSVGVTQHKMGDLTAAFQSKKRASEIRRTLFGEEHLASAMSYHLVRVR